MSTLLTGPDLTSLERTAMERAASTADDGIGSVLYLTRDSSRIPVIEERWDAFGDSLQLQATPLDSFVTHCHEQAFEETSASHMRSQTRDRLVEAAVERLSGLADPLAVDELPSRGLCDRADELLTLMEFADLLDAAAIEERLREEGLDRQAEVVSRFEATFTRVREEHTRARGGIPLSIGGERYSRLVHEASPLDELVPQPDVVILSGFTLFSPLEREFIRRVVEAWPTIAILPRLTEGEPAEGIDRAIERVRSAYRDMGLEPDSEIVGVTDRATRDATVELTRRLFRERPSPVDGTEPQVVEAVDWYEAPTRPLEARTVARHILDDITAGRSPDDIGVVLSSSDTYGELIEETLRRYDIPFSSGLDRPVLSTDVGEVFNDAITAGETNPRTQTVLSLLSNPLVEPFADLESTPVIRTLRIADSRLDSGSLERALTAIEDLDASGYLDDGGEAAAQQAAIESLIARLATYQETPLDEVGLATEELFADLGVTAALQREALEGGYARLEREAEQTLVRTARQVQTTGALVDETMGTSLDRLERALRATVIERSPARDRDAVFITDLSGVGVDAFDRLYLVGLDADSFPTSPDRLAFTYPINDAHDDFAPAETPRRARYHATVMLAAAEATTLTTAARSLDGTPLIESDLLAEIRRVTAIRPQEVTLAPAAAEDVQRSIAELPLAADNRRETAVDEAVAAGGLADETAAAARAGMACAAARRDPMIGPYDGQLSVEIRQDLHEPVSYSPTALETYASCGFRYLMSRILDIEDPDELRAEATALERGGLVHDILESFYLDIQSSLGEPVTTQVDDSPIWQERLLDVALDSLEDTMTEDTTPFQEGWLTSVFAGLGDPVDNSYHGETIGGEQEIGLLRRFLREEATMERLTGRPTWFEARVGPERPFDRTVVQEHPVEVETPQGPVSITGTVDRIDVAEGTEATELVVRDYKTGSSPPTEAETLDGLRLQLPLYALMAESVLDSQTVTVGGAYYQVSPPASVSHNTGQIGSRERAQHQRHGDGDEPLMAWQYPRFDTQSAFREFIETAVPDRLGQIATGIEAGSFHPTVLDPADAGCEYCGYRHVCDVRSHQRHEARGYLERSDVDIPSYIPPLATGRSYVAPVDDDGDDA